MIASVNWPASRTSGRLRATGCTARARDLDYRSRLRTYPSCRRRSATARDRAMDEVAGRSRRRDVRRRVVGLHRNDFGKRESDSVIIERLRKRRQRVPLTLTWFTDVPSPTRWPGEGPVLCVEAPVLLIDHDDVLNVGEAAGVVGGLPLGAVPLQPDRSDPSGRNDESKAIEDRLIALIIEWRRRERP